MKTYSIIAKNLAISAAILAAFLALAPLACNAAQNGQEVDTSEVRRRGDYVEHVQPGIHNADEYTQIAALPESDLDKFQLIVVGMRGCSACSRLTEAWKTDIILRDWAKPEDKAKSWANFHYVRYDDPLQQWRFKGENAPKIKFVPTIICQPPRSGKYGDPTDVIHQYVYGGDSAAWSKSLREAIRTYVERRKTQDGYSKAIVEDPNVTVPTGGWRATDADTPVGQQQIPPLDLPRPDEARPDVAPQVLPPNDGLQPLQPLFPNLPGRDRAPDNQVFGAKRDAIVIVTDEKQLYGEDVEGQIAATVEMVRRNEDLPTYRIDFAESRKYGVSQEELPVVLRVDARDRVIEKRLPKVETQSTGFVFSILAIIFGSIVAAKMSAWVGTAMGIVVFVVVLFVLAIVSLIVWKKVLKPLINESAPAPPARPAAPGPAIVAPAEPKPAYSSEEIAAAVAALRASQTKPGV